MFILHIGWLLTAPTDKTRGLVVWAETDQKADMTLRALSRVHPFSASTRALRRMLAEWMPALEFLVKRRASDYTANVWLPSTPHSPQASLALLNLPDETTTAAPKLEAWQVEALRFEPPDALAFLTALPSADDEMPGARVGADAAYWRHAGKFTLELTARQRFVPTLTQQDEKFLALWQPLLDDPDDAARVTRLAQALPPLCRAYSLRANDTPPHHSPRALVENFLSGVIDAFAREHADVSVPSSSHGATMAEQWLDALNDNPVIDASASDLRALYEQYRAWAEPFPGAAHGESFRLCFRLEPPPAREELEIYAPKANARDWTLRYLLQAHDDPSLLVPMEEVWSARGSTAKFLNRAFDAPHERVLAALGHASRLFAPIESSLRAARPSHAPLNADQAYTFLHETALLLKSFGFGILAPGLNQKFGVRVRLQAPPRPIPKGGVAGISFDDIVNYDWQLVIGDTTLTRAEFDKLAALKTPLVQIRGQWVELRPEQLQAALKFWEKRTERSPQRSDNAGSLTAQDALRLALGFETPKADVGLPIEQVEAEGWIGELLTTLQDNVQVNSLAAPQTFQGELRPYQNAGLGWLAFLRQWGLGGCLADDMGLGKTAQAIALVLHERAQQNGDARPTLVICPTSVVNNWERELARFAPTLRVYAHHGAARKKNDLAARAAANDVVLSSYPLLQRDEKQLTALQWSNVILDEAQNIKNPTTKQAQAARKLDAQWRLALTGTPVENRLSELWSIFQFLSPGYLGAQAEFQRRFANPIERGGDALASQQLKRLTRPFILRRVKTDPQVISDLPAKNEMKIFCNLTREQATLYEAVVRDSLRRIEEAEGMARRGIVLATLLKLKQVCNHPAQFLGDGSALAGRSGKLARLAEMLSEVRAVRERALVFTQFSEMGKLLQTYLQTELGDEVLFLHGGTPTKTRVQMIDRFQNDAHGPMVFLLSIKAGGTGLNLTRANHVFHFDRWWNPAVENQATDRAFRIGQTRNVQVYKYLCADTFEEQIDGMIERKKELAQNIVGTSEGWLTELSTAALRDVFKLRQDAIQ